MGTINLDQFQPNSATHIKWMGRIYVYIQYMYVHINGEQSTSEKKSKSATHIEWVGGTYIRRILISIEFNGEQST